MATCHTLKKVVDMTMLIKFHNVCAANSWLLLAVCVCVFFVFFLCEYPDQFTCTLINLMNYVFFNLLGNGQIMIFLLFLRHMG